MWDVAPWILAMLALVGFSGFFSASEAALFSLRITDRRTLAAGTRGERTADSLLDNPDRLLTAVLFWNLMINMAYFAVSSIVVIRLEKSDNLDPSIPITFAVSSLFLLIFLSEMLPKSIGVLRNLWLARRISLPLSLAVRIVDPVIPAMRTIMLLSQRLMWPNLTTEPYMQADDLQKVIKLSTDDAQLIRQEETVLNNIVELSNIRVDEWMVPRSQYPVYRPPVSLSDLEGQLPRGGYLLISEPDSDEIESAIDLHQLWDVRPDHLEYLAEPVLLVPWCATVAQTLERMKQKEREVVAVVNEFGETIGVLTFEDILDTLFNFAPSRSKRILNQNPVHRIARDRWLVSGMTSVKRLGHELQVRLPDTHHITVCGVIQDSLQRIAAENDDCEWGPLRFKVLEMPHRGHMLVEVTILDAEREQR